MEWPPCLAWRAATPAAITISPRKPRSSEGNDSTSVTASLPRNWRLRARMRRSETIPMLRSPLAFGGATRASQGPRPRAPTAFAAPPLDAAGASGVATLTRRRAAAICVVSLDDGLHEFVPDDIAFVEINE